MPSPRSRLELACRIGAFGVLGWTLGMSVSSAPAPRVDQSSERTVAARLVEWTRHGSAVPLQADLPTAPAPWVVAWLAALRHSGHPLRWTGSPPAVGLVADAIPTPMGGALIELAATSGAVVVVRDAVSVIDSVRIGYLGAAVTAQDLLGDIAATSNQQQFGAKPPPAVPPGRVLVVAAAGWEGKFVADALEDQGWEVSTRFSVAPNAVVGNAARLTLDTSAFSAVVAVDTTIGQLGDAVERFVRSGGGLVLAGASASAASLLSVVPGTLGPRREPAIGGADASELGSSGFFPVQLLMPDGVVLERRSGSISMAARRIGPGRVIQLGYDDTWLWRMTGPGGSDDAHREWWSRIVGSVAYIRDTVRSVPASMLSSRDGVVSSAPLADAVARLGPARSAKPTNAGVAVDSRILVAVIMLLLLIEWASRRTRGLP